MNQQSEEFFAKMSEELMYISQDYKLNELNEYECCAFRTVFVYKQRKGWYKMHIIGNYKKIDGVWKRRNFGTDYIHPVYSGRLIDGMLFQRIDGEGFVWNPISDEYINIVNNCTETFLQPLYN